MASFFEGYKYYDSKDGEDCHKKVWFMTKMGLVFSAWAGPAYCAMVTQPVGVWQTAHSLGVVTVPVVTAGATFAATSCALTNLRGKDDAWNAALGGLAAGSIFGAAKQSLATGGRLGAIFAGVAVSVKMGIDNDWKWWEAEKFTQRGTVGMWRHDWTLRKDPSKMESQ